MNERKGLRERIAEIRDRYAAVDPDEENKAVYMMVVGELQRALAADRREGESKKPMPSKGKQAALVCTCSENLGCPFHFPNQYEQATPGLRELRTEILDVLDDLTTDDMENTDPIPIAYQRIANILNARAALTAPVPQTARERHEARFLDPESTCFGQPFSECHTAYCAANRPALAPVKETSLSADRQETDGTFKLDNGKVSITLEKLEELVRYYIERDDAPMANCISAVLHLLEGE